MHFGCAPRVDNFLLFWCEVVTALVPGLHKFCEEIFVECCVEVVVNFVVNNNVNMWCFEGDGGHWFVVNTDYLGLFIVVLDDYLSRFDEVVVVEGLAVAGEVIEWGTNPELLEQNASKNMCE